MFREPKPEDLAVTEVPFTELPSDAKASTRHEYITLNRLIKCGPSPFCTGCERVTGRHTPACRARFDALIKADKVRAPETPLRLYLLV